MPRRATLPAALDLGQGLRFLILALVSGLCIGTATAAERASEVEQRLETVREDIKAVQRTLEAARGKRGRLEAKLRDQEQAIGRTTRELAQIREQLRQQRERLAELREQLSQQKAQLREQRAALASQLRASYIEGRQGRLKLLLNQEDPASLGRVLAYYEYFNEARVDAIAAISQTLQSLSQTRARIATRTRRLEASRTELEARKGELEAQQAERRRTLAELESQISDKDARLASLEDDRQQLEGLLESLRRALEDVPSDLETVPFGERKGDLPWPVDGPVRRGAGKGSRWQGVWIEASGGEQVRAIARGRVAFADWMRGFGLLLILDHGDGYMSLYGHNQSLYRSLGEWVEAGEVVAVVGRSGGRSRSGLYFGLRHQGLPLNPRQWCRSKA